MKENALRRLAFHEVVFDDGHTLHHAVVEVCGNEVLNSYTFSGEPAMTEWIGGKAFVEKGKIRIHSSFLINISGLM